MNLIFYPVGYCYKEKWRWISWAFLSWIRSLYNVIIGVFCFSGVGIPLCIILCTPPFFPIENFVEFFHHYNTVDGGCVWKVVFDNTRNRVVHEIVNYDLLFFSLQLFVLGITIFCPMGDTWLLTAGLISIILTESTYKDDCLSFS